MFVRTFVVMYFEYRVAICASKLGEKHSIVRVHYNGRTQDIFRNFT